MLPNCQNDTSVRMMFHGTMDPAPLAEHFSQERVDDICEYWGMFHCKDADHAMEGLGIHLGTRKAAETFLGEPGEMTTSLTVNEDGEEVYDDVPGYPTLYAVAFTPGKTLGTWERPVTEEEVRALIQDELGDDLEDYFDSIIYTNAHEDKGSTSVCLMNLGKIVSIHVVRDAPVPA